MQAYLYYLKMRILTSIAYRFEVFSAMATSIVIMFATIFLWKTAYRGIEMVEGVNESQMITYAIVSALLGSIFHCHVEQALYNKLQEGSIVIDFIRPTNPLLCHFAEDVGGLIGAVGNRFLPVFIFVSVVYFMPLPPDLPAFFLFLASCGLSFIILWLLSAIFAVINLKLINFGNISEVKNAVLSLLSGSIIPLWFFPDALRRVLRFFPFQYTYQTPLGIFIGKFQSEEALVSLAIQGVWIIVLGAALCLLWNSVKKSLIVQGG